MTDLQLRDCLKLVAINYNRTIDKTLVQLWTDTFIKLDANLFGEACRNIILHNKFFPTVSEVANECMKARNRQEKARIEALKNNNRLLVDKQENCVLCNGGGYCTYRIENSLFVARCVCPHGSDLNKFSESQIKRDNLPECKDHYNESAKKAIRSGKNPFYILTIREVLGDDFVIYEAQKKAEKQTENVVSL